MTRQFFGAAGIGAGIQVVDVGGGAGELAFRVTKLVGLTGARR
jgi:ubiquinone/menaquinone biosynthesis C-methylase UbiE